MRNLKLLVAKKFYEGEISVEEFEAFMAYFIGIEAA